MPNEEDSIKVMNTFCMLLSVMWSLSACDQGGSIARLFHRELECYLVAEGSFANEKDKVVIEEGINCIYQLMFTMWFSTFTETEIWAWKIESFINFRNHLLANWEG